MNIFKKLDRQFIKYIIILNWLGISIIVTSKKYRLKTELLRLMKSLNQYDKKTSLLSLCPSFDINRHRLSRDISKFLNASIKRKSCLAKFNFCTIKAQFNWQSGAFNSKAG